MIQIDFYLLLQQIKMNIAIYLSEQDDNKQKEILQKISFSKIKIETIEDERTQLGYLYSYIEENAIEQYDKYIILLNKFLTETNFLTIMFNNEITKNDFLNLMQVWQLNRSYQNSSDVIKFIKNNYKILKPFKNITVIENNLELILNYVSKLLIACQCLNYQEMLNNKDYLNTIYEDTEYLINKKSN